jgi:UDP-glucose 4-epimerase
VLVTGGAGFLGSHLVSRLLNHGMSVDIIDDFSTGSRDYMPSSINVHKLDITDNSVIDIVKKISPTDIIHLAAIHYVPYCNNNPEETFNTNVMGTRNILEACGDIDRLERLIYASSAAVYPPSTTPHSENDDIAPIDIYGRTKLIGEDLVKKYSYEENITTSSLRLFNIYGSNETNPHVIPAILDQISREDPTIELGNTTPRRDFIHVDDVVDAFVKLITTGNNSYGTYNVGTGKEHSVEELVSTLEEILDIDVQIMTDDERVRESDRPHLQADCTRISEELGWTASRDLRSGIERTMRTEYSHLFNS